MRDFINIIAFLIGLLLAPVVVHATGQCYYPPEQVHPESAVESADFYDSYVYAPNWGGYVLVGPFIDGPFGSQTCVTYPHVTSDKVIFGWADPNHEGACEIVRYQLLNPYSGWNLENPPPVGCDYQPEHCTNGVADSGELGIDCGGDCNVGCKPECPSDSDFMVGVGGLYECRKQLEEDRFDNCPNGYELISDGTDQWCEARIEATLVRDETEYGYPENGEQFPPDFERTITVVNRSTTTTTTYNNTTNETTIVYTTTTEYSDGTTDVETVTETTDGTTGETTTTVENTGTNTTTTTVDNGDGTSTTTTVETNSTAPSGDPSAPGTPTTGAPAPGGAGPTGTTTTIVVTDNTTGEVIEETETFEDGPPNPEENPDNYDWALTPHDSDSDGSIPDGIVPEKSDLGALLDEYTTGSGGSGVTGIITGSGVETSAQVCSLDTQIFGRTVTIDFCNVDVTIMLETLGNYLVAITYLAAIFLVFL